MMRIKLKFYTTVLLLISFAATHVCANGIDAIVGYDTARRIAANTAGELMFDDYGDIVSGNILDAKTVIDENSAAISAILENQDNVQVHVAATDDDREKIFKAILAERLLAKKMDGWETETVNPYAAMLIAGTIRADLVGHYKVLELMYSLADTVANSVAEKKFRCVDEADRNAAQQQFANYADTIFKVRNSFYVADRTASRLKRCIFDTMNGLVFVFADQGESGNLGSNLIMSCLDSVESGVNTQNKRIVHAVAASILEMPNHPLTSIAKILQDLCSDAQSDLSSLVNIQKAIKDLADGNSVYKSIAVGLESVVSSEQYQEELEKICERQEEDERLRKEAEYEKARKVALLWTKFEESDADADAEVEVEIGVVADFSKLLVIAMDPDHRWQNDAQWALLCGGPIEIKRELARFILEYTPSYNRITRNFYKTTTSYSSVCAVLSRLISELASSDDEKDRELVKKLIPFSKSFE